MKKLLALVLALMCLTMGAVSVQAEEPLRSISLTAQLRRLWAVEAAIHMGYLEEEGIEVNLVEFADGPTIIAAMENGSIDVGYIGQGAHKLCVEGRADIFGAQPHLQRRCADWRQWHFYG